MTNPATFAKTGRIAASGGGIDFGTGPVPSDVLPTTVVGWLARARSRYVGVTAVMTSSTMGATFDSTKTDQFNGAILAPTNVVYGVADQSPNLLIVDDTAGTATRDTLGMTYNTATKQYNGGVYIPATGLIYLIPYDATTVMVINPATNVAVQTAMGADLSGGGKWRGGCIGANGLIYTTPGSASDILVIDPLDTTGSPYGTAHRSSMGADLSGTTKWVGLARSEATGVMYAMANNSANFLRIDPANTTGSAWGTATRPDFGLPNMTDANKWQGIALGADGKLYGAPFMAVDIPCIDPITDTATRSNMGCTGIYAGGSKWELLTNGPDGRLYCHARSAKQTLRIDPIGGTAEMHTFGGTYIGDTVPHGSKWQSGVQTLSGHIIGIPQDADVIQKFTFPGVPALPSSVVLDPLINKG